MSQAYSNERIHLIPGRFVRQLVYVETHAGITDRLRIIIRRTNRWSLCVRMPELDDCKTDYSLSTVHMDMQTANGLVIPCTTTKRTKLL